MTLDELPVGRRAVVLAMENQGSLRRRLRDLGLIEGTLLSCLGHSPLGDPSAYAVRGAAIALRREDSGRIMIRMEEGE